MPAPKRTPKANAEPEQELIKSINSLRGTITRLPEEYSHVLHPGRHLVFTYVKGVVYGLGVLSAVAIVIPLIIALLRQVEWVPLVGNFVHSVSVQIEGSMNQ